MKILWVSSRVVGPASKIIDSDYHGTSGGWIQSEYDALELGDNSIGYLCGTRDKRVKKYKKIIKNNQVLYLIKLPSISNGISPSKAFLKMVQDIINDFNPSIIHLWGTETVLQTCFSKMNLVVPRIVFIQGLMGVHSRYLGGYSEELMPKYSKSFSIKELFFRNIRQRLFKRQAHYEKELLVSSDGIITDNQFSESYCFSINNNIKILKKFLLPNNQFFEDTWKYEKCEKNTIFTVFSNSPEKGLHQLLHAVKILKCWGIDVIVKIPGNYHLDKNGMLSYDKTSTPYERWIFQYIKNNGLTNNVVFLGPLCVKQMSKELIKCNLFINPSIMEVHALSLREAMASGVPCISTMCGSVKEYLTDNIDGVLYRYEEYEYLAYVIKDMLNDAPRLTKLGANAKDKMTFEKNKPSKNLMDYYLSF